MTLNELKVKDKKMKQQKYLIEYDEGEILESPEHSHHIVHLEERGIHRTDWSDARADRDHTAHLHFVLGFLKKMNKE